MIDLERFEKYLRGLSADKNFWVSYDKGDIFLKLSDFEIAYSSIARRFRNYEFSLPEEVKEYFSLNISPALLDYSFVELLRFLLLLKAPREFVGDILLRGDDAEQALALKSLSFLPDAKFYRLAAVNNCRTNSLLVFSAIALENEYPAKYFNDEEFSQMVLKAIFLFLDFSKIIGVNERCNELLLRQLNDLHQERRSAGRNLPENVLTFMKEKELSNISA